MEGLEKQTLIVFDATIRQLEILMCCGIVTADKHAILSVGQLLFEAIKRRVNVLS